MGSLNQLVIPSLLIVGIWVIVLIWRWVFMPDVGIKIITFTGPSGVGKTAIVGELLKKHSEWKIVLSLTSRESRESDLAGEYKCDVIKEEFFWRDRTGEFIWMASVHGNMYGTLLDEIRKALNSKCPSLIQISPDSVKQLRAHAPGKILSIFILPPSGNELRRRLDKIGKSPEEINRKITDCKRWEKEAVCSSIPYQFVTNDSTISEAVEQVENIINTRHQAGI